MPWARLDDRLWHHRKVNAAGPLGLALFAAGLSYCNDLLTDGFIPETSAWQLVSFQGISDEEGAVTTERVAAKLVAAGLWHREPEGYRVHDYFDYNKSAEQIREERQQAKDRMQGFRQRSREVRANFNGSSATPGNPVPGTRIPDPEPEIETADAHASGADAPRAVVKTPSKKQTTNGRAPPAHAEQFDALIDGLHYDRAVVLKAKAMRDCLNTAAKQLDALECKRDDVLFICDDLRQKWKGTDFGPMAVAKWAATYERGP